MKHAHSISLGSVAGDFEREITMGSETVKLVREGMDVFEAALTDAVARAA